jgi:hypothetical protein
MKFTQLWKINLIAIKYNHIIHSEAFPNITKIGIFGMYGDTPTLVDLQAVDISCEAFPPKLNSGAENP